MRFDWNAGQVHVITFTGQLALNGTDPQSIGSTSLPQVGGNNTGNSGSGGLQITSRFNNGMMNAFRGGYIGERQQVDAVPLRAGRPRDQLLADSIRAASCR